MVIVYLVLGKAVIWLVSTAKPTRKLWDLFDHCSLCLGFWVYLLFALWLRIDLLYPVPYLPFATEVFTAALTTVAVFIFSEGWRTLYHASN